MKCAVVVSLGRTTTVPILWFLSLARSYSLDSSQIFTLHLQKNGNYKRLSVTQPLACSIHRRLNKRFVECAATRSTKCKSDKSNVVLNSWEFSFHCEIQKAQRKPVCHSQITCARVCAQKLYSDKHALAGSERAFALTFLSTRFCSVFCFLG